MNKFLVRVRARFACVRMTSTVHVYIPGHQSCRCVYIDTPGLYELLFKRIPDDVIYTEDNMQKYKSILMATSAHKCQYDVQGQLKSNKRYKYKQIMAPLMSIESKKKKIWNGSIHTSHDDANRQ